MDRTTKSVAETLAQDLKHVLPEENQKRVEEILSQHVAIQNQFFDTAHMNGDLIQQIIEKLRDEEGSSKDLFAALAPEIRKAFGVQFDPENGAPGQVKFKKNEQNLLDEIGMSNQKLAEVLELFSKCYNEDKDEDWHEMSQLLLGYVDRFFAPSYEGAKDAGLLDHDDNKEVKS